MNLKSLNTFKLNVNKVDHIANFVCYGKTRLGDLTFVRFQFRFVK